MLLSFSTLFLFFIYNTTHKTKLKDPASLWTFIIVKFAQIADKYLSISTYVSPEYSSPPLNQFHEHTY